MIAALAGRFLREPDRRVLRKFMFTFGLNGLRAVRRFQKRVARDEYFPAFLFISVTNTCNLSCQGCWITPTKPPRHMPIDTLGRLVEEARKQGCRFFGILGGEPLMYAQLQEVFERHPDCYFLLFTNGTLIDAETARRFRDAANVTPLVSVEGSDRVSDVRRGGNRVYERTMDGIDACVRNGLITGVATSVCKSNIDDLASEDFLRELIERGVHYVWYYVYRPVGPRPAPELALDEDDIVRLRRFMVEARGRHPIVIVDSYWDHEGHAMCAAATGIGYHVSPDGYVEPCPPIQLAGDNVGTGEGLYRRFVESDFLARFRELSLRTTRGCIVMEHPDLLLRMANETNAHDSSGRDAVREELAGMKPRGSHSTPGREIPEKHWLYRFAKKNWFFGFGAYG